MAKYRVPDNLTNDYLKDKTVRVTESYPATPVRAAYEVVYEGQVYSVGSTTVTFSGSGAPDDRTAFIRTNENCVVRVEERVDPLEALLREIDELEAEDCDLDDAISKLSPDGAPHAFLTALQNFLRDVQ